MKIKIFFFCWLITTAVYAQKTFYLSGNNISGRDGHIVQLLNDKYKNIASDTIRNEQFELSCQVDNEMIGSIYISGEDSSPLKTQVIIEEGTVEFFAYEQARTSIKGGTFNKLFFEDLESPEYLKTEKKLLELTNGTGRSEGIENPEDEFIGIELFLLREELKVKYYSKLMNTSKDAKTITIAALLSLLQPNIEKAKVAIDKAALELGEDNNLIVAARKMHNDQEKVMQRRIGKEVGNLYTDFTAFTLSGDTVQLSSIVNKHKYTVLTFWASWCGPCRKEMPLERELYTLYKPKGLAMVSFSLDDKRSNWEQASKVEQLVWYNISDMMGFKSDIVKNYPIIGIPANVIIDNRGKIVASNIIGDDFENKIKELFE